MAKGGRSEEEVDPTSKMPKMPPENGTPYENGGQAQPENNQSAAISPLSKEPSLLQQKVNPALLQAKRILTDEQIAFIKHYFENNPDAKKFSRKEENGLPFSVIKTEAGKLFALYYGKEAALGVGNFGAVKLAQDIDSGEWVSIKIQKVLKNVNHNQTLANINAENKVQQAVNQFKGSQIRDAVDKNKPITKAYTVMKFIPAQEFAKQQSDFELKLQKLLDPATYASNPQEWQKNMLDFVAFSTNAAATTTQDLANLHNENIIHRDLHTGNILVDGKGTSTIIDFGLAINVDPTTKTTQALVGGRRDTFSPEVQQAAAEKRKHTYSPAEDMWSLSKCMEAFQFSAAILYFGNDLQIPHPIQRDALLMIEGLSKQPALRPEADKLSSILKIISNYAALAKGLDLKNASQEDISAYKTLIAELGPSNHYSTVNVTDKKNKQLEGMTALKMLGITPSSKELVGTPLYQTPTQDALVERQNNFHKALASHNNIHSELLRQIDSINKHYDSMIANGKWSDAKIVLDHLNQDLNPQLKKNFEVSHEIDMDIKMTAHQLQRIKIAPSLQTNATPLPKTRKTTAKQKTKREKIPSSSSNSSTNTATSKRAQSITFAQAKKEKVPFLPLQSIVNANQKEAQSEPNKPKLK